MNKTTKEFLEKFDNLCEEYANEDIEANVLDDEIRKILDNYC